MKKINGITYVIRDGVWYPFFDIEHTTLPTLPSNSAPSGAVEDNLWKQTQGIFLALKDPNLDKKI